MNISATIALTFLLSAQAAPASTEEPWKYAGEDQGIRFSFRKVGEGQAAVLAVRLESTLNDSRQVRFRVRDSDWHESVVCTLPRLGIDSNIVIRPRDQERIAYPFIDQVYLGMAPDADPSAAFNLSLNPDPPGRASAGN